MKAKTFFTRQENGTISETIRQAETRTAGEIAVMVVDQSDTYPEARIMAGLLLGGLPALIAADLFFGDSLWIFVPLTIVLALLLGWAARFVPWALRFFLSGRSLERRVQERAVRAFYEKGLYKTRDNTGVLFFISLLEHKVWVLADEGIYRKIRPEDLQEYASEIAAGVKSGRACAALCKAIDKVGMILAEHFPIRDDDANELSNAVMTD